MSRNPVQGPSVGGYSAPDAESPRPARSGAETSAHLPRMDSTTPTLSGLEPLMSIEELSEYLNVPVRTLYDWRLAGMFLFFWNAMKFASLAVFTPFTRLVSSRSRCRTTTRSTCWA